MTKVYHHPVDQQPRALPQPFSTSRVDNKNPGGVCRDRDPHHSTHAAAHELLRHCIIQVPRFCAEAEFHLDDPRVNWNREGIKRGGISIHREKSETWNPSPQNVALLRKHLAEFLELATGGPARYTGRQLEFIPTCTFPTRSLMPP